MKTLLTTIIFLSLCSVSKAQIYLEAPAPGYVWVEVTEQPRYVSEAPRSYSTSSFGQNWANKEASNLASGGRNYYRRTGGHPGGCPSGHWVGTGWSTGSNPDTCVPWREGDSRIRQLYRQGRLKLVGDATVRGRDATYRARIWKFL